MKLILASTSPYRRQLLSRLGIDFEVVSPHLVEDEWKDKISDPQQLVVQLACAKAHSVANSHPEDLIIGSDQLAVVDTKILGKPGNREQNIEQLKSLSGRSHQLLTAVCVLHDGQERILLDVTSLRMRSLTDEEITTYVDLDQPWDCSGGYKFEVHGVSLFEEIRCTDMTAIEGLPLLSLGRLLREFGLQYPQSRM